MVLLCREEDQVICDASPFPPEVDFVISALEAAGQPHSDDQRRVPRSSYRVRAALRLYSDDPLSSPRVLYTRNVSEQAIAFLSAEPLPLSHGGILHISSPDGRCMQIACTVLRCSLAARGWYEGALYFNRQQPAFEMRESD